MLHFVDSGAHTLINQAHKGKSGKNIDLHKLYDGKEFWKYVDAYAKFIKKNAGIIDLYPNVDVIRDPKRSWKVQRYLEEEHGLKPIPVVHYRTPLKWIAKYIERGHRYMAFGGPVKRQGHVYHHWADNAWNLMCDQPSRLPLCRVHGFSVTTFRHIIQYPWWSVDSVTWKKMAYYGQILVPQFRNEKPDFTVPNLVIFIDPNTKYSIQQGKKKRHFLQLEPQARRDIKRWLKMIDVHFGESGEDGSIIIPGVSNDEIVRRAATIKYYEWLAASRPEWPWPFPKPTKRNSLTDLL